MIDCPCCSAALLRHIRQGKLYWYCTSCHQEMPVLQKTVVQSGPAKSHRRQLEKLWETSTGSQALEHLSSRQ